MASNSMESDEEVVADSRCSSPTSIYKDPDDGRQRFLLELEFVQCFANPTYIHYLAQNRYFEDEAFIGYLKYLQYWQRPEYIKFIMYPHCLFFLELLQNVNFRNAMAHPGNKSNGEAPINRNGMFEIREDESGKMQPSRMLCNRVSSVNETLQELAHRQQFYFWKNYRNNRFKHILPKPLPEPTPTPLPLPPTPVSVAPQMLPNPPVSATTVGVTSPASALSPMQYAIPPGSGLGKNDMKNSAIDRRKRKHERNFN